MSFYHWNRSADLSGVRQRRGHLVGVRPADARGEVWVCRCACGRSRREFRIKRTVFHFRKGGCKLCFHYNRYATRAQGIFNRAWATYDEATRKLVRQLLEPRLRLVSQQNVSPQKRERRMWTIVLDVVEHGQANIEALRDLIEDLEPIPTDYFQVSRKHSSLHYAMAKRQLTEGGVNGRGQSSGTRESSGVQGKVQATRG